MQNLQDLQQKIFFESMTILETLSKITTKDELLSRQELFSEVADRIAFLRILEKNSDVLTLDTLVQTPENQYLNLDLDEISSGSESDMEVMEDSEGIEEVIFNNEINEIADEQQNSHDSASSGDITDAQSEEFNEIIGDVQQEAAYEDRVAQKEQEFLELEERRRKIVEFNKKDIPTVSQEELGNQNTSVQQQNEKKFKLAHIKGLKAVQNFFDADPLDKLQEEESQTEEKLPAGSLLKTNIPTDFMEAEKKRPGFRLDLNDKVAFTKILFNNDEQELTRTIEKLNSYNNLEDAKKFLSEIYYLKDWQKSDEYAQRLWSLVENKFL